jgi:hypothetical protein
MEGTGRIPPDIRVPTDVCVKSFVSTLDEPPICGGRIVSKQHIWWLIPPERLREFILDSSQLIAHRSLVFPEVSEI